MAADEGAPPFAVGDKVEYKDSAGAWRATEVIQCNSDGTYILGCKRGARPECMRVPQPSNVVATPMSSAEDSIVGLDANSVQAPAMFDSDAGPLSWVMEKQPLCHATP
jgi:hypothetical protein